MTNHLFTVAALLVLSACVQGGEASNCGDRNDLLESVFRFQFDNNYSSLKNEADAYYIAIEGDQDPDALLLDRFSGHQPPVMALSKAGRSPDHITNPESGKAALIFRVRKLEFESPTTATVNGGYFEGPLSASFVTMKAECSAGSWHIEKQRPQKISTLSPLLLLSYS